MNKFVVISLEQSIQTVTGHCNDWNIIFFKVFIGDSYYLFNSIIRSNGDAKVSSVIMLHTVSQSIGPLKSYWTAPCKIPTILAKKLAISFSDELSKAWHRLKFSAKEMDYWYFVSKIVLIYFEKQLF